jgi:hypothetical protein
MADEEEREIFLSEELDLFRDNPVIKCRVEVLNGTPHDKKLVNLFIDQDVMAPYASQEIPTLENNMDGLVKMLEKTRIFSHSFKEVGTTKLIIFRRMWHINHLLG